jgi:hypothetical protein
MKKIIAPLLLLSPFYLHAQHVGVGTTIPQEKLHVAGNIKSDTIKPSAIQLTPNAGAGKILTSDADGNGNWENLVINTNPTTNGATGFGPWGDCTTNAAISAYNPVTHPEPNTNDQFGRKVSLSGNFAVIGAAQDNVTGIQNGSAHVFQFDGEQWNFMQMLTDPSSADGDFFGVSVSISGNYIVIGASQADVSGNAEQGTASVFYFDGSSWVFMQQLTDPVGGAGDNFGSSICIHNNTIIVGSNQDDVSFTNQGSAHIFQFDGSSWVYVQQLTAPDGAADDLFGHSVAVSGEYAVVGSYLDDVGADANQGSAYVFHFNGSSWDFQQQLTDLLGTAQDNFGYSVAISGNYIITGAYHDDAQVANGGSANVFHFDGSSWIYMERLIDTNPTSNEQFGYHVSISGKYALVGANRDNTVGMDRGAVTIYHRVGPGWQRLVLVTDPGHRMNDEFGVATAIDETTRRFLIGAHRYRFNTGKALFGKIN